MKSSKYRFELRRGSDNYVLGVFSRANDWFDDPEIVFEIPTDEPLRLWEFISETRIAIVDWYARVWIYEVEEPDLVFQHSFSTALTGKAVLSEDLSQMHIIYDKDDYHHAIIDLDKLEIISDKKYPLSYVRHCELYKDSLMLYFCSKRKGWNHGYDIIDLKTGEHRKQALPDTKLDDSDKKSPYIDHKNDKIVFPYYTEVAYREDADQGDIFTFQVAVVDLKTFELEKVIPVRDMPMRLLECYEDDAQKAATNLKLKPEPETEEEKKWQKAVKTLNGNLNSLTFDEDGKSFWICWRGGIVRRVDYDGNLSPLYAKVQDLGEGKMSPPFEDHFNHSVLYNIYPDRLVILEHSIFAQIRMEDLKGKDEMSANIEDVCPVQILSIPEDDLPLLDMATLFVYKWESMLKYNMF